MSKSMSNSKSMSSKIKGGGRAILSTESQQAIIDLLMSFDNEVHETYGCNNLAAMSMSAHDKKRAQKKFMKQLIQRHEQRQLQMKFNAAAAAVASDSNQGGEVASNGNVVKRSTNNQHQHQPVNKLPTTTTSSNPNVRIELVEAIFKQQDKNDKKEKKKSKDKDKDKKSTNNKKSKSKSNTSSSSESSSSAFTVGTKKLVVLPRTTSIKELLQKSKSKLKLKKTPVRAFIQVKLASSDGDGGESSSSALFDLDIDLSALDDGTVLFVSVTSSAAAAAVDLGAKDEKSKQKEEVDDTDEDGSTSDNTTNKQMLIDPLDSVKRAYQQQEAHRYQSNKQLERMDEIVDHDKRSLLEVSRATLPVYMYKDNILDTIGDNPVVVLSGATGAFYV